MIIEGEFYRLTPVNDHSNFYDLELLYDIGGKNPRKEFKIAGYGLPIEIAMDSIVRYAIFKKFKKDEIITLKQYYDEYSNAKKDLQHQFK